MGHWGMQMKCSKVEASIPVNLRVFTDIQMHVEFKIFTVA